MECNFCAGVDSMPQDLQRYVTQLREIELEKRGMGGLTCHEDCCITGSTEGYSYDRSLHDYSGSQVL